MPNCLFQGIFSKLQRPLCVLLCIVITSACCTGMDLTLKSSSSKCSASRQSTQYLSQEAWKKPDTGQQNHNYTAQKQRLLNDADLLNDAEDIIQVINDSISGVGVRILSKDSESIPLLDKWMDQLKEYTEKFKQIDTKEIKKHIQQLEEPNTEENKNIQMRELKCFEDQITDLTTRLENIDAQLRDKTHANTTNATTYDAFDKQLVGIINTSEKGILSLKQEAAAKNIMPLLDCLRDKAQQIQQAINCSLL